MLTYTFDETAIELIETANDQDVEFRIHVLGDATMDQRVRDVQHDFDHNHVMTDVLFYAYHDHKYQFIVRKDYYEAFILSLMKHHILTSVTWL
jgi:hypothetical protein